MTLGGHGGRPPLLTISRGVQAECRALPLEIARVPPAAILPRRLSVKSQRRAVVQVRGILAQMFGQQFRAQRAYHFRVPERGVHLRMAEKRIRVKIAGADCRPRVVDQHDLAMDVDVAATSLQVARGDSNEREVLVLAERSYLIEEVFARGILTSCADVFLRFGRNEDNDIYATREGIREPDRDLRNRE